MPLHPRDFFVDVKHSDRKNRVICKACGQEYFYHSRTARQHLLKCTEFDDIEVKREIKRQLDELDRIKKSKRNDSDASDGEVMQ